MITAISTNRSSQTLPKSSTATGQTHTESYFEDIINAAVKNKQQSPSQTSQKLSATTEQNRTESYLEDIINTAVENKQKLPTDKILVGTTSKSLPTISQLLMANDQLDDRGWNILQAKVNRDKPYTSIPSGTKVYINPETDELMWGKTNGIKRSATTATSTVNNSDEKTISLGVLNGKTPTISHLLASNQTYGKEKWNILALPINAEKNFTSIPAGSTIQIDAQTKEITWCQNNNIRTSSAISAYTRQQSQIKQIKATEQKPIPQKEPDFSTFPEASSLTTPADLSEAVQQYIGTPYKKMNCFGLVVKGLKNMGIQYNGTGGLQDRLIHMATRKGLPANTYLNGEGIVEAAGSKVLYESFNKIDNPTEEANKTLAKMSQKLQKGQILSFSTPTRGHTGIISRQSDGEWTFINSGKMDHPVSDSYSSKEVGEENLLGELRNWFSLASKRKESLTVTLGQVERAKVQNTGNTKFQPILATI